MYKGQAGMWSWLWYRGQGGMWAWVLHRITGLGVVLFLFLHVLDTALVGFGPTVYNDVVMLYRAPAIRVLEVLLVAAVVYHALNGLRVILVDFWEGATRVQQALSYAVAVAFLVIFLPSAFFMLRAS